MIIDGKKLSSVILTKLKEDIKEGKKHGWAKPKLVIFAVKPNKEIQAYIKSKQKKAELIGADVEVILYKKEPRYIDFANRVSEEAQKDSTHGIIIQHPLPASLSTVSLLDYVPLEKEIEGFKKKAPFEHPIGLAVLTMLKSVFSPDSMEDASSVIINIKKDLPMFKNVFKRKRVVLLGRGTTGGAPIGNTLSRAKINYINLNSTTPTGDSFIEQANVIISAVGKRIVDPKLIKKDVVLISVGLHKYKGKWIGDYDEDDIKDVALAYSPTPGGVGPLNVAYLLFNLVEAWKMQHDKPART